LAHEIVTVSLRVGPVDRRSTIPTVRSLSLVLVAALLGACFVPREADLDGIVGTYVVNGVDPSGLEYSGSMTIEQPVDGRYPVSWIVTGAVQEGVGTLDGAVLSVEWNGVDGGGSAFAGTADYSIAGDGSMTGVRRIDGYDGVGTEEVFPGN
jgi:hypothetical protein